MTAKEYLNRIRQYKYQIAHYYLRLEEMYTILSAGAIDYSKDKVQTSPSNKMEDVLIQIDDIKTKRLETILEMERYIEEAQEKIEQLGNISYMIVLTERFINLKRYESIAEQMHLENNTIRKICVAAVKRFDDVHKEFLKSVHTNPH